MIVPAEAIVKVRMTYGSQGYFQQQTIQDVWRIIAKGNIPHSLLTSQGFKHISEIEPTDKAKAYEITYAVADGKKQKVIVTEHQKLYDFNKNAILKAQELEVGTSGVLYNVSTDLRCSGTQIKLQVANILSVKSKGETEAYSIKLTNSPTKAYIDNLENEI